MQYKLYDTILGTPITHTLFTGMDLEYILKDLKNKGYNPELKNDGIYIDKLSSIYDIEHYANTKNVCKTIKIMFRKYSAKILVFDELY